MTTRNSSIFDAVLELAAQEASNGEYPVITPAHLLMALSKLSEAGTDGPVADAIARLRFEFEQLGVEPRSFRRGLRALMGNGGTPPRKRVMHRSPSCRMLFPIAEKLAAQEGIRIEPIHLLRAAFLAFGEVNAVSKDRAAGQGTAQDDVPDEL